MRVWGKTNSRNVFVFLRCDAQELSGEVALVVQNFPLVPEANELLAILGRFDLDGLLQSHDEIARLCGVYEPVVPVIIPHQHSVSIHESKLLFAQIGSDNTSRVSLSLWVRDF